MSIVEEDRIAKAKGQELVSAVALMPEVEEIIVEPYVDHTGDRALELTFRLKPGVVVDNAFLDRFIDFKGVVQTRILHSNLNRFPYTRLQAAA